MSHYIWFIVITAIMILVLALIAYKVSKDIRNLSKQEATTRKEERLEEIRAKRSSSSKKSEEKKDDNDSDEKKDSGEDDDDDKEDDEEQGKEDFFMVLNNITEAFDGYLNNTMEEINEIVTEMKSNLEESRSNLKQVKTCAEEVKAIDSNLKGRFVTPIELDDKSSQEPSNKDGTGAVERIATESKKNEKGSMQNDKINSQIIELYRAGMDKAAIAQKLEISLGEVDIVTARL